MDQDAMNEFLEDIEPRRPSTIELATALTEGRENLTITMRKPFEPPVRQESPARNHVFWDIEGFCAYLEKHGTSNAVVLADPTSATIRAVLDDKADKGFEIITFIAQPHPQWKAWEERLGKQLAVKDFGKWLLTQKALIKSPKSDLVIQQFAQVRASKKVEYQTGYGDGSINGVQIEVEIRGQQPDKQLVKLPTSITIECPMYIGWPALEIEVELILDTKGDVVVVELYSGDADEKKIAEIDDMLSLVKNAMPDRLVSLGKVNHQPWQYVKEREE